MAIYTLDIEADFDFEVIGISSHEKDYRLAWNLNRQMGWRLVRKDDIVIRGKLNSSDHPVFQYVHPVDQVTITLIDNKTEHGILLPEAHQCDYLIKLENLQEETDEAFYRKLRSIRPILTAFPLVIGNLKSKHNLIF